MERKMRFPVLLLTAVTLVGLASVARTQQPGSLIVNGSFEVGPAVKGFLNLANGDTSVRGWVVTGEGVDYVSTGYWLSSDGPRAIDLDGSARSRLTPPYVQGGIEQTFATTPGTRYLVTFDLAGNPNQLPRVKRMRVSAAGQEAEFTFDTTGKTGARMGWTPQHWTFTANAASTTLEFRSLTVSPQTGYSAAIDNVAVVPEPAPLEVVETEKEIQVSLGSEILFDTGRYDLKPAATAALESLLTLLARYPKAPILIEGHTDSTGTAPSNQVLSERRSAAVKQWLVDHTISAALIMTTGRGQTAPIASNDTTEGRQKNRRVEIRIQK
jgi:choice-of-anchor C domain-containing protein